jgi:hypothetical protein
MGIVEVISIIGCVWLYYGAQFKGALIDSGRRYTINRSERIRIHSHLDVSV